MRKDNNSILIRRWLWRYHDAKHDVIRLEYEYKEMVEIQESAGAISYDGMPGGSGEPSDLSALILARDEAISRLLRAKNKQARIFSEISKAVSKLDYAIERDIISMRYLTFLDGFQKVDWTHIASSTGFSDAHVKRVHGIAIQKLINIVGTKELRKLILNDTK